MSKGKKECAAYVDMEDQDLIYEVEFGHIEESEVDVVELKPSPPYVCKLLTPTSGKNPSEPKENDKFPKKTYTFDVTKCDEIFDLLVADGQVLTPLGAKVPPLEQRKKQGFCKYHNFLGCNTSQCFLFRDLVQNSLNEGRLMFAKGTPPMKIDFDPLDVEDASYVEPVANNMVKITEDFDMAEFEESENQIEVVFPKDGEGLVEFLYRCKFEDSEVMPCPRCSVVFDKKAVRKVESAQIAKEKEIWRRNKSQSHFDKRVVPQRKEQALAQQKARPSNFKPTLNSPQGRWTKPAGNEYAGNLKWITFEMGRGSSLTYRKNFKMSERCSYGPSNYKDKNPMSRTRRRMFRNVVSHFLILIW